MIVEVGTGGWPASAMALGLGVWISFGWCWWTCPQGRRLEMVATFGIVMAAAIGGGLISSWIVGERGLSWLGGIVGGATSLVFVQKPWAYRGRQMLDCLVPGGLMGLSVARLGCLFEGCDFGRLSHSGLAVVHQEGSRAWMIHLHQYGLDPARKMSLEVYPFAAYLALWGVFCAAVGEWIRRRGGSPGRAATAGAALFFAGGGAIEWLREPQTVPQLISGVSVYPSIYLCLALIALGLWWYFGPLDTQQ